MEILSRTLIFHSRRYFHWYFTSLSLKSRNYYLLLQFRAVISGNNFVDTQLDSGWFQEDRGKVERVVSHFNFIFGAFSRDFFRILTSHSMHSEITCLEIFQVQPLGSRTQLQNYEGYTSTLSSAPAQTTSLQFLGSHFPLTWGVLTRSDLTSCSASVETSFLDLLQVAGLRSRIQLLNHSRCAPTSYSLPVNMTSSNQPWHRKCWSLDDTWPNRLSNP